jgi:predicted MFS family arabinose efflux permease
LIYGLCGFISAIFGGLLTDKLSVKHKNAKSWLCVAQNLIGLPFFAGCYFFAQNNFWLALSLYTMKMLISESYISTGIKMIQNTSPD